MDNFDQDCSSANGKRSTHSLAIIMIQPNVNETKIKRLSKEDSKKPIDHEIVRYNGPKSLTCLMTSQCIIFLQIARKS
jgi:hypothetical protein